METIQAEALPGERRLAGFIDAAVTGKTLSRED